MITDVVSTAQRPDLVPALWTLAHDWPEFLLHSPVADRVFERLPDVFPDHQLLALDRDGTVVGKVHAVPIAWSGRDADLPARGWDAVLERAFDDAERGVPPTAVSLLEARLAPAHRGHGQSAVLLRAAREAVARSGVADLVAPVRPTRKAAEPRTPMAEYVARVRADGLPVDPWLRTHVRLGARVVAVCPVSMTVAAPLVDWRAWTGLPLARTGPVDVPGALTPVHVSVEQDVAVYVEPNVWVHARLSPPPGQRSAPAP